MKGPKAEKTTGRTSPRGAQQPEERGKPAKGKVGSLRPAGKEKPKGGGKEKAEEREDDEKRKTDAEEAASTPVPIVRGQTPRSASAERWDGEEVGGALATSDDTDTELLLTEAAQALLDS